MSYGIINTGKELIYPTGEIYTNEKLVGTFIDYNLRNYAPMYINPFTKKYNYERLDGPITVKKDGIFYSHLSNKKYKSIYIYYVWGDPNPHYKIE